MKNLREEYFKACGCHSPWDLLSAIVEHILRLETAIKGIRKMEGPRGRAATVSIGNVETVEADQPAEVTNVGTDDDAVFDFKIPRGNPGQQGFAASVSVGTVHVLPYGQPWRVRNVGTRMDAVLDFYMSPAPPIPMDISNTVTLLPGSDAFVRNLGTDDNIVLEFGIPQGIPGDKGDPGEPGDKGDPGEPGIPGVPGRAATVSVGSTHTLDAGEDAYVENVGTQEDAILDFYIPKGDSGAGGIAPNGFTATLKSQISQLGTSTTNYPITITSNVDSTFFADASNCVRCLKSGYIELSAVANFSSITAGDAVRIWLWVNSTATRPQFEVANSRMAFHTIYGYIAISPIVIHVNAGDYILFGINNLTAARGTVEAVDRNCRVVGKYLKLD